MDRSRRMMDKLKLGLKKILKSQEERFIFFPEKKFSDDPQKYGVTYENVYFETEHHRSLHGWYFHPFPKARVLFYLHGNAGNISDRSHFVSELIRHLRVNLFIFDYQGYGKSEGSPSEMGMYQDARAAYDILLHKGYTEPQIIIYGKSLGGAVAIDLAAQKKMAALIVENTFTSAYEMARHLYPYLPHQWMLTAKFDSLSKMKHIHVPKLFIHATQDPTVPYLLGQKLFEAAPQPKVFYAVPSANHGASYLDGKESYFSHLNDFLLKFIEP